MKIIRVALAYLTNKFPFLQLLKSNQGSENQVFRKSLILDPLTSEYWNCRANLFNFIHQLPPVLLICFIISILEDFYFLPLLHELSRCQHTETNYLCSSMDFDIGFNWIPTYILVTGLKHIHMSDTYIINFSYYYYQSWVPETTSAKQYKWSIYNNKMALLVSLCVIWSFY